MFESAARKRAVAPRSRMNNMMKNLVIWLVIGLVLMTVFNQFNTRQTARSPLE